MKMEVMVVIGKDVVLGSGNDGDIIMVMEPEAQYLRQHMALVEDLNLVLSTHGQWLTITCNFSSRGSNAFF